MKISYTIILAALLVSPVMAEDARRIDFTAPIVGIDGKPIHETQDEKSPIATIGSISAVGLLRASQPDPRASSDPVKLAKRAILAQRIATAKDAELTSEEISEIKSAVTIFGPLPVLRVLEAIDPASLKK